MTAQYLRSRLSEPQLQRFTLVFRNGELLRHQDHLAVAQYRSDARLAWIEPELAGGPLPGRPERPESAERAA